MCPLGDRVRKAPSLWRPENKLIPEPLVVLIQAWLQKRRQMIEALVQRIAAGTHRPRPFTPRATRPDAARKPPTAIPPEKQLPPRVFGWINRLAAEINVHANGLSHIIGTPEMKAMILASPQLARLWVPLLNALGQSKPDWWPKPPPRPRRPRPPRPRTQKPRKPIIAGPDPAATSNPTNPPPWRTPAEPPSPPQRYASDPPRPPGPITSWRDFLDSVRPVSLSFEPPVVDDPVPYGLPGWTGVQLPARKPRW
jgi:hypothetical protein